MSADWKLDKKRDLAGLERCAISATHTGELHWFPLLENARTASK